MRIRDPGSGMETVRIRDKHPGSATLSGTVLYLSPCCYNFFSGIILDSDLADGHVGDGFLYGLPLALLLVGVQLRLQLEYLPLLRRREIFGVRHCILHSLTKIN
jgi:hypothetical protein